MCRRRPPACCKAILAGEGETVAVGAAVAVIETRRPAAPAASAAPRRRRPSRASHDGRTGGHFKSTHAPQLVSFRRDAAPRRRRRASMPPRRLPPAASVERASPRDVASAQSVVFTRRARRRARGGCRSAADEPAGSGRGGRITKRDVARFLAEGGATRHAPTARDGGQRARTPAAGRRRSFSIGHRRRPGRADVAGAQADRAAHAWSVRISPHATAQTEGDMSAVAAVLEARDAFRAATARR